MHISKLPVNFTRGVVLIVACVVFSLMMFHTVPSSHEITDLRPPRHQRRPLTRKHSLTKNSSTNRAAQHLRATECHSIHRYLNTCSSLPNYFLHGTRNQHEYKDSMINFWHVQKTGGTSLEHCLIKMYNDRNSDTFHINISTCENREKILEWREYFQKAVQPVIRGHSSLGFCEFAQERVASDRKCSNFVMFREPFERMVSFYYYSRDAVKRNIRSPERLRRYLGTNITEWVKNRGSSYWEGFTQGRVLYGKDNPTRSCGRPLNVAQKWPSIDAFSESIVNNLDRYFSVVGLTEDFAGSLELFQRVYGLPFVETCSDVRLLEGRYENGTSAAAKRRLREKAKRDLVEDEGIRQLMRFDVMIYQKAKELFYKQKDEMNRWKGNSQ